MTAIPLKYNFRSLFVRRISTLMTLLSIALVVAIFVGVMSLAGGLETALGSSGDPQNVLVRREASDSELSSTVSREAFQWLRYLPGVATGPAGDPIASAEIVIVINLPKHGEEQGSNITVRGISPEGMALRPEIKMVEGRQFQPGLREVIVSRRIADRFQNTAVGDRLPFGKVEWEVVGIFDAGNTAFASEIWADVNQLADDFNRREVFSCALLKAQDQPAVQQLIERIEVDQRFNLMAQSEATYYDAQTQTAGPIKALGMFIAVVMGVGACFAGMNTMYAAVSYRKQEIATLRVLGFRRRSILASFMTESLLLSVAGGLLGCLLVLPINGLATGTANWTTFSEVAFAFTVTPGLLLTGLSLAVLMGLVGGFFPARQASIQPAAMALRKE